MRPSAPSLLRCEWCALEIPGRKGSCIRSSRCSGGKYRLRASAVGLAPITDIGIFGKRSAIGLAAGMEQSSSDRPTSRKPEPVSSGPDIRPSSLRPSPRLGGRRGRKWASASRRTTTRDALGRILTCARGWAYSTENAASEASEVVPEISEDRAGFDCLVSARDALAAVAGEAFGGARAALPSVSALAPFSRVVLRQLHFFERPRHGGIPVQGILNFHPQSIGGLRFAVHNKCFRRRFFETPDP